MKKQILSTSRQKDTDHALTPLPPLAICPSAEGCFTADSAILSAAAAAAAWTRSAADASTIRGTG
jgi:hypothetical protein